MCRGGRKVDPAAQARHFRVASIQGPTRLVYDGEGMMKPATSVKTRSASSSDESLSRHEALVRAFDDIRDELISTLWFVLGNREDAQDSAQEAFLKCWRTQDSLAGVRDLRAWIFRVAINAAKDMQKSAWHRKAKSFAGGENMLTGREPGVGEALEQAEALEQLRLAILDLRPDEKEVFLLRQNGELTYEQIAEMRKSPIGTVKTQMRSALQKLRRHMAS
jgi:RNA polymerase sigma-70 factor (ECF subfamily)